jgi:UDP-GlcNAc3NAcA epimerase
MKIITVVGARPQFIKAAVLSRAIFVHNGSGEEKIEECMVHTGQHYDYNMSQVFFDELEIPNPHYNLGIGSGCHGKMTGAMLEAIEKVLLLEKPDLVMVYGDTNSTLAGCLAAVKLHIPVAHVEAGLRSFNRKMPEEINRVLTDHAASYLFCPTPNAVSNLEKEGIREGVFEVGDVMYDAVIYYRKRAIRPERKTPFILASLHRAENTEDPQRLRNILSAMNSFPIPVVLPLHPRTKKALDKGSVLVSPFIEIIDPLPYLYMLGHLEQCTFVLTDSGGLQKEAYFFGKKCLTVRDETEWIELVECGANRVVGADETEIQRGISWAMESLPELKPLYGNGNAGTKILQCFLMGGCQC